MAIEAGRVLNERYRLIRPVGQGSQASVWVAEHLALTTHVAVKLIDPELAKKETARERFRREATAAAQLRSAHVVQILDHGIDGDQPFIVMELLDGEDLFERLAHRTRLSLRETSKIVTQVARALSRAHQAGIVHRDLKPENVFLVPNEDDEIVKVLDFGVAKIKSAPKAQMKATGVGTLIGTPHYMSPEQVKGIAEVDYRTDLWALGVIAFQCVTGELPFDSEGVGDLLIKISIGEIPVPSKVFPSVPPSFDAWYAKAAAREPGDRFQSAREMAVALAGVVSAVEGGARSPTVRPPAGSIPGAGKAPARPGSVADAAHELGIDDFEEIDSFDEAAPPASTSSGLAESHDIVDFDATIPATDVAGLEASYPVRVSVPGAAPASPPRQVVKPAAEAAPRALIAPVVMMPPARSSSPGQAAPRPPATPVPVADRPAPTPPRPPRPEERPPQSAPRPRVDEPVAARKPQLVIDPPAEFTSNKRGRIIGFLVFGLLAGVAAIGWTLYRSQPELFGLGPTPSTTISAPPPASSPPPPTATVTTTSAAPTASAVDPGRVTHPGKPAWTAAPKGTGRIPRPRAKVPDGTIEVPDPPADDSVPPAD